MEKATLLLERTYHENQEEIKKGGKGFKDVLIVGSPGVNTERIINEWINSHKTDIRPCYCFANTRPYTTILNGVEMYFGANETDTFDHKDAVLIIKHFDLTHKNARRHLLKLVSERRVNVRLDGPETQLSNLKMIIATAYPESHFGYDPLSEAEMQAFDIVISV